MTPEQRSAALARLDAAAPEASARLGGAAGRYDYQMVNHPLPARASVGSSPRFRAAGARIRGRR